MVDQTYSRCRKSATPISMGEQNARGRKLHMHVALDNPEEVWRMTPEGSRAVMNALPRPVPCHEESKKKIWKLCGEMDYGFGRPLSALIHCPAGQPSAQAGIPMDWHVLYMIVKGLRIPLSITSQSGKADSSLASW